MYLSKKAVVDAALKALDEGKLQLQTNPTVECPYQKECALGVALPPEKRVEFDAIPLNELITTRF